VKRLRVLVSAHEFCPYKGSECAEGWNIVLGLAAFHDVTVLYASGSQFKHQEYKETIDKYFEENKSIVGLSLVNIEQPYFTKKISFINKHFLRISAIGLPVLYFIGYHFWQKAALKKAIKLHQTMNFDLVHQLTQITFREPGYLWKLGIPFVWGPTGGNSNLPASFRKDLSFRARVFEKLRTVSNSIQFNLTARVKKANTLAKIIYCFSKEDAILFQNRANGEVKLMLEAGTYQHDSIFEKTEIKGEKLKVIWCGQFIERKDPLLFLQSIVLNTATRNLLEITIIGAGPLKSKIDQFIKHQSIENVTIRSGVSHDDIFKLMHAADFLVHTSFREATSNVILEALSCGLPIICYDINGMSVAVDNTCGIKIPLVSRAEGCIGFNNAMMRLIADREFLQSLKNGAENRADLISWEKIIETIALDYHKITDTAK
jgi:glycosyltransferase involved in cell wall biosynthesis